jgi:peptide methionine sulfoxide reductase MsrB
MKVTDEKSRIRIQIRWSKVRTEDPDPYQNVTDPECGYFHIANSREIFSNLEVYGSDVFWPAFDNGPGNESAFIAETESRNRI